MSICPVKRSTKKTRTQIRKKLTRVQIRKNHLDKLWGGTE
jgi:hypothetical protein